MGHALGASRETRPYVPDSKPLQLQWESARYLGQRAQFQLSLPTMAIDVHTILTLPSSKAFSSFNSAKLGIVEAPRSDSPPRKTPRLAADSDSASASRSRDSPANNARTNESSGSVVLKLQGLPSEFMSSSATKIRLKRKSQSIQATCRQLLRFTVQSGPSIRPQPLRRHGPSTCHTRESVLSMQGGCLRSEQGRRIV